MGDRHEPIILLIFPIILFRISQIIARLFLLNGPIILVILKAS